MMNQWQISDFISLKPHYNPLTQALTALISILAQCAYLANQPSTSCMFLQSSHNQRCKATCTGPTDYSVMNCELPINLLTPNDPYSGRTTPLTSKCCILFIYSINRGTEYFKHGIYSPFFPLQNAVCFINLTYLVPV